MSEAGYYKYKRAQKKPYKYTDLLTTIHTLIKEDPENSNYRVKRIFEALKNYHHFKGSYSTIYRICQKNNLMIRYKRRPKGLTKADREAEKAENLIQQDFTAEKPNEKWLTDITEIPCSDAKLYLAPILDCYDGSILGFKMDTKKYHRFLPSMAGYPIAFFCQGQSHKWCFTSLTEKAYRICCSQEKKGGFCYVP
ncbi:hypothetical protein SDC9_137924 [bioreactor metagenome]|uniref:HTH-like domain-containing protein n=1 Tax=bioreactor metagenome TaxID=1076179 RepID=A0A645DQP5_9ZZZZ